MRIRQTLITIASFAASWLVYFYGMRLIFHNNADTFLFASAIMSLLAAHEIGHLIAFRLLGIRSFIVFFVLGGVTISDNFTSRKEPLTMTHFTFLYIAGVVAQMFLMSIAAPLYLLGVISYTALSLILLLNTATILVAMVPGSLSIVFPILKLLQRSVAPKSDGHGIISYIFKSVPEFQNDKRQYALWIATPIALATLFSALYISPSAFQTYSLLAFLIMFLLAIFKRTKTEWLHSASSDDFPHGNCMRKSQRLLFAISYTAIIVINVLVFALIKLQS